MPLSGGARWFVALRCYAEEFAISLSTQAQDSAWDFAEFKRVELAHYPTGATFGGTGTASEFFFGQTTLTALLCARALSFE